MIKVDVILKKWIFYCITFLMATFSFGQNNALEFDHYTTNEGLSYGYTNCIFQDSKGFIWIGTARGLNRFDGLSFKTYFYDAQDSTSISGNLINAIVEDSLKNMWLATSNNLDLYDHKKDQFIVKSLRANNIVYNKLILSGCFIDSKGYMWVASYGAIFRFKIYNNPQIYSSIIDAERFTLDEEDVSLAYKVYVFSIVEDKDQRIWLASYSNKLFYFDENQNAFVPKSIDLPEIEKASNSQKYLICDSDGDLLITTDEQGLIVWNRKNDIFRQYKSNGTDDGPNDDVLCGILQAQNGKIWIASRSLGGINVFDKSTGKFAYYVSDPLNPYSISTNSANCFFEDKSGNMWIGTGAGKGLEKYCPYKKKFQRYYNSPNNPVGLSSSNVLCFAESHSGDIWVGTDGQGLNKLNKATGTFEHFLHNPRDRNSISSNAIISLNEDSEGTLWIASFNGGLCKKEGNIFTSFFPEPSNPYSISSKNVWYVLEDSKKNLWAATLTNGIDLFDRKTNRFYNYASSSDTTSVVNNAFFQIFEDSKHNLYFTSYGGVSVLNLNEYDFSIFPPKLKFRRITHSENKNSISSDIVYCVAEDKNGIIWFGTQATGLDRFDPKTGKYTNYSTQQGLPGNSVSSILVDDKNNLWLATEKGLAKYNQHTDEFYVFDNQDGLQNKSLKGWALKTTDGEMYFGGPNGFNSFYPDSIKYNKNKPTVIITGLKLFNQPVKIGETYGNSILLKNDISETRELVFNHHNNFFTFEFVALDYTVPEKNMYAYKMEGFDNDWIYCGTHREASYTNLDPGKYTFKVIACNNDGLWNETGTSLQITILPPWWKTIWFRVLFVLVIINVIGGIFILRLKVLMQQKVQLEKIVKERTSEIEEKNAVLVKQTNQLYEVNTLIEERNQFIEEQNHLLIDKSEKLTESNILLSQQKAHIEEQSEELRAQAESLTQSNELLQDSQTRIEEQSEALQTQADYLQETNELLQERQEQIQIQTEELTTTNQQLTTLNATKDKFFSIIAHDLKNPFNNILGFCDLLLSNYDKYDDTKKKTFINTIYDSSINIYKLLENLLQWARSQTGKLQFTPEDFLLNELIITNIDLAGSMIHEKNLAVRSKLTENIHVYADKNMISTIIRNLITNAIKFTDKGEITIDAIREDTHVRVIIQDTGVGMSPEKQENIFNIGNSKSTKGTRGESGTGLGLILCKDFVEKNGGQIWVESIENQGSSFIFTIPDKK